MEAKKKQNRFPLSVANFQIEFGHRPDVIAYLPQGIDSIYLEIFDERAFSTDERVAWHKISIPESVFNGDTIDDWYTLSGQQGDAKEGMINIVFTLYPVNAPHVAYVPVQPPQPIVVSGGGIPPTAVQYSHAQPIQEGQQQVVAVDQQHQVPAATTTTTTAPAPARPMYTDEDVKELQEMFVNMDVEAIKSVLYEKRGNKEATVNALLTINADTPENPSAQSNVTTITTTTAKSASNDGGGGQTMAPNDDVGQK